MCTKYPELKESQNWYNLTVNSNEKIFSEGHFEDGVCIEQGMGYIQTFMGNISTTHNGIYTSDAYYGNYTDVEGAEHLRQILETTLASTSWDYGEFDLGDSNNGTFKSLFERWYKILTELKIDDEKLKHIKYAATGGKEGEWFDFTSNSFPYGLRTYMRTGWTKDDIMLAFTNKGNGESHGHRDQMHIVLKAYGQDLLVDSYGSNLEGEIRRQEVSASQHNTITVNGGSHSNRTIGQDGVEKEQEINDIYNFTTYSSAWVDNAKYAERNVLFLKNQGFFIVSDYVQPSNTTKVNTITQHWHMDPYANIELTDNKEFRSNFESGANVIISPVGADTFSNAALVDSKHGMSAGVYIDTKKGIYERETSDTAKFGTVIFPLREGDDRTITTEEIDVGITNNGASAFKVTVTDHETSTTEYYYYYHLSDLTQKKAITIGDYTTDATSLLVQEDAEGNVVSFFIYDGSYIEGSNFKDKYLLKSTNGNITLAVDLSSGSTASISSDSVALADLDTVTVRTGGIVTSATFNGETIENASKSGAYMYFGDEPIVECTEFEEFYPNFENKVLLESLVFNSTYETSTLGSMVVNETFTDNHGYGASYTDDGLVITRTKDGAASSTQTKAFSLNFVDYLKDDVNNTELYQQGFTGVYAFDITLNSNMTPVGSQTGRYEFLLSGKLGGEDLYDNEIRFLPKSKTVKKYFANDPKFTLGTLTKGNDKTIRLVVDTVNNQLHGFDVDTTTSPYTYTYKGKDTYTSSEGCESITSLFLVLREYIEKDSTLTFKKIDIYEVDRKESCVDALPDSIVGNSLQIAVEDITIPAEWKDYTIVSSNPAVLGIDGKVTRGTADEEVRLTVSGNNAGVYFTKIYNITVKGLDANDPNYIGGNLIGDYDLNAEFAETDLGKMVIVEQDTEKHSVTYTADGVTVTRTVDGTDDSTSTPALALNFATMKDDEANKTKLYSQSLSGIYAFDLTFNADLEGYGTSDGYTDFYYTDTVNGSQSPASNNLRLYTEGSMSGSISYGSFTAGEDKTIRLVVDTVNKKVYSYDVITDDTKPIYIYKSQNDYSVTNNDTIASLLYCTRNYLAKDSSITFKNLKIYEIDRNEEYSANVAIDSLPDTLADDPTAITEDIVLPAEWKDYVVESSDTSVLKANGDLVISPVDKDVSLTVSGTKDGINFKKTYNFSVKTSQMLTQGTKIGDYDLNAEFAQTDLGKLVIKNGTSTRFSTSYENGGLTVTRTSYKSGGSEYLTLNFAALVDEDVNNKTETYQRGGFSGVYGFEVTMNANINATNTRVFDFYMNTDIDSSNATGVPYIRYRKSTATTGDFYYNNTNSYAFDKITNDSDYTFRFVVDTDNNKLYCYNVDADGNYSSKFENTNFTTIDTVGCLTFKPQAANCAAGSSITFKNIKVYEIDPSDAVSTALTEFENSLPEGIVDEPDNVTDDFEMPAEFEGYTVEISDETVIAPDGTITRGTEDQDVTVTVSGSKGNINFKKVYKLTVKAEEMGDPDVTEPTLTVGDYTKSESTIDFEVSVASPEQLTGIIVVATYEDKTNRAKAIFYPVKSKVDVSVNSNNVKYIKVMWLEKETFTPISNLVKFDIE